MRIIENIFCWSSRKVLFYWPFICLGPLNAFWAESIGLQVPLAILKDNLPGVSVVVGTPPVWLRILMGISQSTPLLQTFLLFSYYWFSQKGSCNGTQENN